MADIHGQTQEAFKFLVTVRGNGISEERVAAYLPSNFKVIGSWTDHNEDLVIDVVGYDSMGWTFQAYVQPRLASGNMFAQRP